MRQCSRWCAPGERGSRWRPSLVPPRVSGALGGAPSSTARPRPSSSSSALFPLPLFPFPSPPLHRHSRHHRRQSQRFSAACDTTSAANLTVNSLNLLSSSFSSAAASPADAIQRLRRGTLPTHASEARNPPPVICAPLCVPSSVSPSPAGAPFAQPSAFRAPPPPRTASKQSSVRASQERVRNYIFSAAHRIQSRRRASALRDGLSLRSAPVPSTSTNPSSFVSPSVFPAASDASPDLQSDRGLRAAFGSAAVHAPLFPHPTNRFGQLWAAAPCLWSQHMCLSVPSGNS